MLRILIADDNSIVRDASKRLPEVPTIVVA